MSDIELDWIEGKYPLSYVEIIESRAKEFTAEIHKMAQEAMPKEVITIDPYSELGRHFNLAMNIQNLQRVADLQNLYVTQHQAPHELGLWRNILGNPFPVRFD